MKWLLLLSKAKESPLYSCSIFISMNGCTSEIAETLLSLLLTRLQQKNPTTHRETQLMIPSRSFELPDIVAVASLC